MKIYAPDYYTKFHCIADECRHSCCVGWEIDIDEETCAKYKAVTGAFGERLKNGMVQDGDAVHFKLTDRERCPFLNSRNLCDIILELGEDSISQICTDHPRFRNFFENRTELGLGLCCEAAGELILLQEEKMKITQLSGDDAPEEESEFFAYRDAVLEIAQNREIPLSERIERLKQTCCVQMPEKTMRQWADFYLGLERMENQWTNYLCLLKRAEDSLEFSDMEVPFEQLLIYFLYRHLPSALYDGYYAERIGFAILSVQLLQAICGCLKVKNGGFSEGELIEIARLYSAEIEYSEKNTEQVLEEFLCTR